MTTVVWRAPFLAADQQLTGGVVHAVHKLARFHDRELGPCIFGAAGLWRPTKRLLAWIEGGREGRCPSTNEVDVLVVIRSTMTCEQWESDRGTLIRTAFAGPYVAIGTGANFALGALHAGASVRRAIAAAAAHDELTGKGVQVIRA